jgi:secondary thiamine-phosphate synthase enzyme
MQVSFAVQTPAKSAFVEITEQVRSFLRQESLESGMAVVYVPHTTAGITINENADPDVVRDFLADLDRLIPQHQSYYRHYEGNSAAHLKTSLMGSSVTILVENSRLVLGTWQGIYLCEFDGPRNRKVHVKLLPDPEHPTD